MCKGRDYTFSSSLALISCYRNLDLFYEGDEAGCSATNFSLQYPDRGVINVAISQLSVALWS